MGRRRTIVAVVAAALLVAPLAVWASDRFEDVPDSNVFHDDISWLADAGVTFGCNPPDNTQFCPDDNVTRAQMAAFMRRLSEGQVVAAASAIEADHATEADHADNADHAAESDHAAEANDAGHAKDSDTLGGLTAAEIVRDSPLVLSAADFSSDGSADWAFTWSTGSWRSETSACGGLQASVHVPNGSTIDRIRVFVLDTNGDSSGPNFFTSNYFNGNTSSGTYVEPAAEPAIQAVEIEDAAGTEIDNEVNHYYIGVCLNNGDRLYAAQVDYEVGDVARTSSTEEPPFGIPPKPDGKSDLQTE